MNDILHVSPVMPTDERHIEQALDQAKFGGSLVTSWVPSALESRLFEGLGAPQLFARRETVELNHRSLDRSLLPDVLRSLHLSFGGSPVRGHDDFFKRIDRRASQLINKQTRLVIGRELGSLETLKIAKERGCASIYHMPTAHHDTVKRMIEQEEAIFPGVCDSTFDREEFGESHISHKSEELELAETIICPSSFVHTSLTQAGIPEGKVVLTPYGSESSWLHGERTQSSKTFLFVGNITARKGAHRLLKAWKALGAYRTHDLLLVGSMHLSPRFLADHSGIFRYQPRVPRRELISSYLSAAALVLPALAEGFALVISEAASCGTPVLASMNSGAAGFFESPDEALLFEAADDEALMNALDWALSNPNDLEAMGRAGRKRAASWLWSDFESRVLQQVQRSLNVDPN